MKRLTQSLLLTLVPLVPLSCERQPIGPGTVTNRISPKASSASSIALTDLGTLGGTRVTPLAISERGHVVGHGETTFGDDHAFLWTPTTGMVDLGTFGGQDSFAGDINSRGQIVGFGRTVSGINQAALWEKGAIRSLTPPGTTWGAAWGVNDRGQVLLAASVTRFSPSEFFIWSKAKGYEALGLSGTARTVVDINNVGQVIGQAVGGGAYLWSAQDGVTLLPPDLAGPMAVNNRGQIVGQTAGTTGLPDAFVWTGRDGTTILPGPPSLPAGIECEAADINNAGEIVGTCFAGSSSRAVLWTKDRRAIDLGSDDAAAIGINERGQIVGTILTPGGWRGVLWEVRGR